MNTKIIDTKFNLLIENVKNNFDIESLLKIENNEITNNEIENNEITNNEIENNEIENNETNFYNFIKITLCISYLCIICLLLLIIFTIIILVNTNKNNNVCPSSNLWYYTLVSLLLLILSIIYYKNNNKHEKYFYNIICYLVITSIIIGWGTYEIFCINCINKLYNTNLYKIAIIHWIYNISFCGINTGLFLGLILYSINFYNI